MSKANHFQLKKLQKEFNEAMNAGNLELAKEIDAKMSEILGY